MTEGHAEWIYSTSTFLPSELYADATECLLLTEESILRARLRLQVCMIFGGSEGYM